LLRASDVPHFNCLRCGLFAVTSEALADYIHPKVRNDSGKSALVSHYIRRSQSQNPIPTLKSAIVRQILEHERLPTPGEQSDNFIQWLGTAVPLPGKIIPTNERRHGAIVGVASDDGYQFIVESLKEQDLIRADFDGTNDGEAASLSHSKNAIGSWKVRLTFKGWARFGELQRGARASNTAFMAMKYGETTLTRVVDDCFRPAVQDTGYTLFVLPDDPKAGLIDDRLRVSIRAARFLVSDLTHDNAGAYWEAGYAEGLGKPVIYTCEAKKFKEKKSHFDTNHHLHVEWDAADLEGTAERLKNTIRATIPEAKQDLTT